MKNRRGMPTWLAASPMPLALYISRNISATVALKSASMLVTGVDGYARAGCG